MIHEKNRYKAKSSYQTEIYTKYKDMHEVIQENYSKENL